MHTHMHTDRLHHPRFSLIAELLDRYGKPSDSDDRWPHLVSRLRMAVSSNFFIASNRRTTRWISDPTERGRNSLGAALPRGLWVFGCKASQRDPINVNDNVNPDEGSFRTIITGVLLHLGRPQDSRQRGVGAARPACRYVSAHVPTNVIMTLSRTCVYFQKIMLTSRALCSQIERLRRFTGKIPKTDHVETSGVRRPSGGGGGGVVGFVVILCFKFFLLLF